MNAKDDLLLAQATADAVLHRRLMENLRSRQKFWAAFGAAVGGLMSLCVLAGLADSLGFWTLPKQVEAQVIMAGAIVFFAASLILIRLHKRLTLLQKLWIMLNRSPALEPPKPISPAIAKSIDITNKFFGLRMILHLQVVLMVVMIVMMILLCIIRYRFF